MYKNQLQKLAQRSCFGLPSYTCIREGPDHAPRFKATVDFNGEIFESPHYCSTLRQAEHSAAEVALDALSNRGPSHSLAARNLDDTRRRKGRPSKADLARRRSSPPGESGYELRRGQRLRNVTYNFDFFDDYLDEVEEVEEEDEERRRQKKLKQVLKLNQSRARADPPARSRGRAARHSSDYDEEEEEEDEDEAEEEEEDDYDDEEDASEKKRQVKKRRINRREEEKQKDYEEEEEEGDHADSDEDDDKERKRSSDFGSGPGTQRGPTPIYDKKPLELILDKLQRKDIYGVYAEPVDPEELPDYHDIIEHPMDFSTVRKKLANGSYPTVEELESDVLLICSNAMQYNSSDTVYYKHARTIQEMGKRKFDKLRTKIQRAERELKTDEKVKPCSSGKKQPRQPLSRNGVEPLGSDFFFGANLANGGNSQNEPVSAQTGGCEKHNYMDVGNTSLVDSVEKAQDLSTGKGLLGKCGRKLSVVEEDRRTSYGNSDQVEDDRLDSIFTTFESEIKQFVAVGLHAEHAYGRSLARFSATLGPVAWKIASQRIQQALPQDFKFGRGWVGEYEPLPTPVIVFETCKSKEAPKKVLSKKPQKIETLFKTPPAPAKEYSRSPVDFVKPRKRNPLEVELNLPPPVQVQSGRSEEDSSNNACVAAARAWMSIGAGGNNNKQTFEYPKANQIAESLYNPAREQQEAFKARGPEFHHPQRNGFPFQTFVQPQNNNRGMVFPQMAQTCDFTRFHVQSSPWQGSIAPHVQVKQQRRENLNLPPDLNIGVHSPDSPAKESCGFSQQPDLALQL